ncbi:GNAT family N-acetyltransferase [Micromonospora tulbaghiae]|uniref:GNAT family N-acetyltransferase n=1 Tax=Micromonospora tulbaghiae TaxID=479978 RepID=A0AAW4JQT4_9ACTN|nr:GNAT family N-acetyltransferase [Micromonospora tulbaghiae]MBO4143854.1 GNAT family N-acetyltransferase [Micromonospora tulbaghiae]MDX5458014.1 GNAT family N-acetyltransferase [Micromonospora tulbaghiae]SCE84427.1 N-acetylglutamate synthase, GNAT family [Micromonospora tulbaghiae]
MASIRVRQARDEDRAALTALHEREWGGPIVVVHDTRYDLCDLPALVAVDDGGACAGALVYRVDGDGLEVVSLAASAPGNGAGSALLAAAEEVAVAAGADRIWLVTTNDNLGALRFYQRRGLRIVAVDVGAADRARAVKPTIPHAGTDGIPLHDELRLARHLTPADPR